MNNQEILSNIVNEQEQAVFKSMRSDMITGKALLNVEQLGYFLREATLDNVMLRDADFKLMKSFTKHLNRVGINGRVLTNGYDTNGNTNSNISPADVDFGANELNVKKLKAMCEIEDDEKEDNMTQAQFEQTLLSMMGERIGEDLEFWSIYGNTSVNRSTNALLNSNDGWIKKSGNNIVSTTVNSTNGKFDSEDGPEAMFDAMFKALPPRFRKNRSNLKFYVPFEVEDAYRNILIARGTGLGDSAQIGYNPLAYKGIPIEHCDTLDAIDGRSIDNKVTSFLVNPKNLAYGVWKNLSVEPKRIPEFEKTQYWFRIRGDVNYYFSNGVVTAQMSTTEAEALPEMSMA